jgi:hypothetical protein
MMGYTGPFPYTNNGTVTSVTVSDTTFSGSVTNAGTISAGGITVIDSSFGGIFDEGFIAGGISIDKSSELDGNLAIVINAATFLGGISNAGLIVGDGVQYAIDIEDTANGQFGEGTFAGGITNNGTIITLGSDVSVIASIFTGDVVNNGMIENPGLRGLNLAAQTFTGDVVNNGDIFGGTGIRIFASVFSGNVTNNGTMKLAAFGHIGINDDTGTFTGNVVNSGTMLESTAIKARQRFLRRHHQQWQHHGDRRCH